MIRIDLLPEEYKRAERTAPAIFLATTGLAVLASSALAVCAYVWFAVVGGARGELAAARDTLASKIPQAAYADQLEKEKREYTSRLEHIRRFSDSRILWTKKLDQLAALIDSPEPPDRHLVWLEELSVDMNDPRAAGLRMAGRSASAELKKLSDFNADLKRMPFFAEFSSVSVPAGEVVVEEDFDPRESWQFEAVLTIKDQYTGRDPKKSGSRRN